MGRGDENVEQEEAPRSEGERRESQETKNTSSVPPASPDGVTAKPRIIAFNDAR